MSDENCKSIFLSLLSLQAGGWVGYFSYDIVRYVENKKLPFLRAPEDDRNIADIQLGLYEDVIVFDHVEKGNMTSEEYKNAVLQAKEHIAAGDIFQIFLSLRFEKRTFADPFEVYRALRIVNPSPYMTYIQVGSSLSLREAVFLVSSSPEILTCVKKRRIVNRPLAGTSRRGNTPGEDVMLEMQMLKDKKQCAEHIMLVDLGRIDVGKVSKPGSVNVEKLMSVERYSHVMHISSTESYYDIFLPPQVSGVLLDHLTCWDALRAALPVGTVSGAPKIKAMELIDQLEVARRGPYSGGFGGISFSGDMDIALALRTMVFLNRPRYDTMYSYTDASKRQEWVAHLESGAGIVADSDPSEEQIECENKVAGLCRAIDLAESAFVKERREPSVKINGSLPSLFSRVQSQSRKWVISKARVHEKRK
ncbi:hypothetical protein K7X08_023144 [Anisodus acutangulus]|uniref:Anthranilate synthase n=1 Tax=Anisodus acutangulus TaxID=402998 RepID=A0A9Q1R0B4_9SOLA|nr:hypothetical protein K7X08_023144 [Anisodus acutangulus]